MHSSWIGKLYRETANELPKKETAAIPEMRQILLRMRCTFSYGACDIFSWVPFYKLSPCSHCTSPLALDHNPFSKIASIVDLIIFDHVCFTDVLVRLSKLKCDSDLFAIFFRHVVAMLLDISIAGRFEFICW